MEKQLLSTIIKNVSKNLESQKNEIAIFLVLNIKGTIDLEEDYSEHSTTTEFFSQIEAQQFIDGFVKMGIYHEVFNGEKEFIEKLASGYIKNLPFSQKIVYSSTGTGLARSKSALIPALCNLYNLKYCSNDIYTAALLENKVHVMNLLSYYDFPVPQYWIYDAKQGWQNGEPHENIKLISKPAYECASLGITEESVSEYNEEYEKFIHKLSVNYNQPIIVEEFIDGFEVEIPVFDLEEPFCPMTVGIEMDGKREMGSSFLTFSLVDKDHYSFYNFDLENPILAEQLKGIAIKSFKVLNLSGILRVDFRISKEGKPYIMDYNNSPHLTHNHSCAFSVVQLGFGFDEMLKLVIWKGLKDGRNSFKTDNL